MSSDKIALLQACDVEFFVDEGELYAVDVQPYQVVQGGELGDVCIEEWSLEEVQAWLGVTN